MHESWKPVLQNEFRQAYFQELSTFLHVAYEQKTIYPPKQQVFSAFTTDLNDIKVVIIGQDPYHGPRQANGLAFSVHRGVQIPPSLQNIFKEIHDDIGAPIPDNGDLTRWAEQGVMLLNNTLTVEAHLAGSHRGKGWERFTDRVIELLAARETPMVFVLWGSNAGAKKDIILKAQGEDRLRHLIITAPHPSPLSAYRGFFGGSYFSRCNYFLEDNGISPVDWSL